MIGDSEAVESNILYEGRIDLGVANNSHTIAIEFIQEHSQAKPSKILEIGCASGYFGEALRDAGHTVWGIEPNPAAASVAARRLDQVFTGTLDEFVDSPAGTESCFDYITFGDVLEHFASPEDALSRAISALRPGGAIVASVPNVAHASVRLMLLEGRWEYGNLGIMDRTHLRFFTRTSLLELFSGAGLKVEMLDCVRLPVELAGIRVDQVLERYARSLLTDDDQDVFQFALLATPAGREEAARWNARYLEREYRRVLCLPPLAEWSVGDIRLRRPLTWWARLYGGCVRFKQVHTVQPQELQWADFVVLQRESDDFTLALINTCRGAGKRVILDMDDLLTEVPPFLSVHAHTSKARPFLERALRNVDAITATTPQLRDRLLQFNKHIFVVPNCASNVEGRRASHYDGQPIVNLIVASSDTVRVEFLIPVLQRLTSDDPGRFAIVAVGPPGQALRDAGLPVTLHPLMAHRDFKAFVAGIPNSIGLIPLDDSVFSSCKSPVKYLDYALAGIPSICSAVPPYTDAVRDGETGLLVENTADSWRQAILDLSSSGKRRQALADAAEHDCRRDFSMYRAALEWQTVLLALPAPIRRKAPSLLPPPAAPSRLARVRDLARTLATPSMLGKAFTVIREEGLRGLRARLRRHGIL